MEQEHVVKLQQWRVHTGGFCSEGDCDFEGCGDLRYGALDLMDGGIGTRGYNRKGGRQC